jgi:hypothetical protein
VRLTVMRIGIASSLALGAVLGVAAPPQLARAADPPASLDGELLLARSEYRTGMTGAQVDGDCSLVVGESWTQTYRAAGTATGPYPGPFTMSGTVTSTDTREDAPGASFSDIQTWTGEFAIDSAAGTVGGTQTLNTEGSQVANCWGTPLSWPASSAFADLTYHATIRPPSGGVYTTNGSTRSGVQEQVECGLIDPNCEAGSGAGFESVGAAFSASTGVTLVVPTKADCANGGYADYGYASEGACKQASKPPKKNGK